MEFFDKNGVRTGGSARSRRHAAEKGSQPQAATPSSDLEVLKLTWKTWIVNSWVSGVLFAWHSLLYADFRKCQQLFWFEFVYIAFWLYIITNYLYKFLCMLFNRFPNLNHRSQKLFTRIRQIRQLPLHFSKKLREDSPNLHFHAASASRSAWRVPRAQRGECLAFSAPLERRLCIFTQLNGASKRGSTVCSKWYSHSHLTTKLQMRLWKEGSVFSLSWTARQKTEIDRLLKPTQPFAPPG